MSLRVISQLKQYRHTGSKWVHVFAQTPKRKGQCKVVYCKRPARVRVRTGLRVENSSICITCASRLFRANNPARYAYRQIKDRAKRKKQIFSLTFEEFLEVIDGTEYLERRGRGKDELHLDRIDVSQGYVRWNLQVITAAENLRKQQDVDYCTTSNAEEPF